MKQPLRPADIIAVIRPHESAKRPAPERFARAFLFIALVAMAPAALAQPVVVTLEQPRVQQSSLFTNPAGFGATNVSVETFNELSPGFRSSHFHSLETRPWEAIIMVKSNERTLLVAQGERVLT